MNPKITKETVWWRITTTKGTLFLFTKAFSLADLAQYVDDEITRVEKVTGWGVGQESDPRQLIRWEVFRTFDEAWVRLNEMNRGANAPALTQKREWKE